MKSRQTFFISGIIAATLCLVFILLEVFSPAVYSLNLKGRDLFFRLKHNLSEKSKQAKDIVLVVLDDGTLKRLHTRWPYPRSLYAEALSRLQPYRPKAIGFDFVFSGEDFAGESDAAFAQALKESGNVVIAAHWSIEGEVGPLPLLRENAWKVGVVDKPRDWDRVLRRAYLQFQIAGKNYHSWELELYKKAFLEEKVPELLKEHPLTINYELKFKEFTQIPLWELLEGKVLNDQIHDKIVLIGLTSEAFHDIHATPFGSMPGLAVNANTLLTLMTGKIYNFASLGLRMGVMFLAFGITLFVALAGTILAGISILLSLIVVYLTSSYFLFANGFIIDVWVTVLGMIVIFFGAIIYREGQLFLENLRLREESARDPLTGFYSRRFLELKLKSEMKQLAGGSRVKEVSVVMIDLDNFKIVNDSFGHGEGDRVLRNMAETIHASVRKEELVCRYGGDEFCVILVNTPIQNAARFAEKLRLLIAENPKLAYRTASGVDTIRVTSSIGVASVTGAGATDPVKLLKAADRALYRAKKAGRNQVCIFDATKDDLEEKKEPSKA